MRRRSTRQRARAPAEALPDPLLQPCGAHRPMSPGKRRSRNPCRASPPSRRPKSPRPCPPDGSSTSARGAATDRERWRCRYAVSSLGPFRAVMRGDHSSQCSPAPSRLKSSRTGRNRDIQSRFAGALLGVAVYPPGVAKTAATAPRLLSRTSKFAETDRNGREAVAAPWRTQSVAKQSPRLKVAGTTCRILASLTSPARLSKTRALRQG
jgi:hypothetical protein